MSPSEELYTKKKFTWFLSRNFNIQVLETLKIVCLNSAFINGITILDFKARLNHFNAWQCIGSFFNVFQ